MSEGGILVPDAVVPALDDGAFSEPTQEFEFELSAEPLPGTHCTCSGSGVTC